MGLLGSIISAAVNIVSIPLEVGARVIDNVTDIGLEEDIEKIMDKLKVCSDD